MAMVVPLLKIKAQPASKKEISLCEKALYLQGQIEPCIVEEIPGGFYQIVDRDPYDSARWHAARNLGWDTFLIETKEAHSG